MKQKDGGPAFPVPEQHGQQWTGHPAHGQAWEEGYVPGESGASLRDYFASQIATEFVQDDYVTQFKEKVLGRLCPEWHEDSLAFLKFEAEFRAKWKYMQADAMLEARKLT